MYILYQFLGVGFRLLFLLACLLWHAHLPSNYAHIGLILVFGWIIAKYLDKKINPFYNRDVMNPEEHLKFREISFELFGYVSKARGQVIKDQVNFLQRFIDSLPKDDQLRLHECFARGKNITDPTEHCNVLLKLAHGNVHLKHQFIEMCVFLTVCDGVLDGEEQRRIMLISRLMHIADYVTERFIREQMAYAHFNYFFKQDNEQNARGRYGGAYAGDNYKNRYNSGSSSDANSDGSSARSGYSNSEQRSSNSNSYSNNNSYRNSNNSNYNSNNNYRYSNSNNNNSNQGSSNNDYSNKQRAHVHNDDLENALNVLDVKKGATFAEIKKAYRKQMKRYHPDRAANASEDVKRMYTEKAQNIQQAYEYIKERYREK